MSGNKSPVVDQPSTNGTVPSKINGSGVELPSIPHVTNNIIPLSNILKFHSQEAYKQIMTIIENLSSTINSESDSSRKSTFLTGIISLRQDFIKLYTLVKWSQNSKDVSKLIDLLNWFRGQEFYFEQLGYGLNELNRFSGAKLPNSDLLTSLEILIQGRPQLPSYNFIKPSKISSEKTLEVLQDLNLVLTTRMALLDDLPARFYNNYEIKDGRIIFTIPNEFQISITVANDLIIYEPEDYFKSPFYFIDLKFLFGINPDTSLITHKDSKIITTLPKKSRENLERVINQVLLKSGLNGLYETLHKYSISFKLYLIARQLKQLSINSKWRNVIQFKYQSSLIIINYWSSQYLSRNWKSFIELGIEKNYNINFRWFKNGKYVNSDEGLSLESIPALNNDDEEDLSVDLILNVIINKHSEELISNIYKQLVKLLPDDSCSLINPHQLFLKLTPTKSTIFSIYPLTGLFYFINPSPIQSSITNKLNSPPPNPKNRNFITEQDMIDNVVYNLIQLKLETFNKEISFKLMTTERITNEVIQLNDYELTKLYNFLIDEKESSHNKIQFYRCKNWPSSWFLINLISGLTSKTYWWVARIKSIKGEWKIQWVQKLKFGNEEQLNYEFFDNLSTVCSNMIIDHLIIEELQVRNINYVKVESNEAIDKFNLPSEVNSTEGGSSSTYESIIMLFNDGDLLPIGNSSTSLFLKIKLLNVNNLTQMKLLLLGNFRNLPVKDNSDDFSKLKLSFKGEMFEIQDLVDLSTKMNENEQSNSLLDNIFINLNKFNQLIKLLDQLNKANIDIINNQINEITINVDPSYKSFKLLLPQLEHSSISIKASEDEANETKLIIKFLNQNAAETKNSIIGSIKYLKEIKPILYTITSVRDYLAIHNHSKLPNGIYKLNFDTRFENLNLIQLIYNLNYTAANSAKKILKDRIMIGLNFKTNKFDSRNMLLVKLSMKDNLNSKNLKYKKLFELIFKTINDYHSENEKSNNGSVANGSTSNGILNGVNGNGSSDNLQTAIIKFNCDYLMNSSMIHGLMIKISDCFLAHLKEN